MVLVVISVAAEQVPLILAIVALAALLAVSGAARHAAAQHQLHTVCLRCEVPFQARSRVNFLGFREMTCPACGTAGLYPLPKVMVVTYFVLIVGACVAVVAKFLTDPEYPSPLGGIWVVGLILALLHNRRTWRRLHELSASAGTSLVPMQRVDHSPGA